MTEAIDRYRQIINHVPLHIVRVDRQLRIQEMNACFRQAFPQARVGGELFASCYDCAPANPDSQPVTLALVSGREEFGRVCAMREGREVHLEVYAFPLFDDAGQVESVVCVGSDVTRQIVAEAEVERQRERYRGILAVQDANVDRLMHMQRELTASKEELERKNRALEEMTLTDALTGLHNRRSFDGEFERETSRADRYGHPLSVIFADIDHFRDFNNDYDYDTGDAVLRLLACTMRAVFRDTDFIARYGGEEFVIILPETDFVAVHAIAERLRQGVEAARVKSKHGELSVTVSIGTATVAIPSFNRRDFFNLAVDALHEAKRTGRNHTVSRELKA